MKNNFNGILYNINVDLLSASLPALSEFPVEKLTKEKWEHKRKEIHSRFLPAIGGIPDPVPCDAVIDYEIRPEGCRYIRRHVTINSINDRITAYLLIPDEEILKKNCAVLALHQTSSQAKDETVGISGKPNFSYGHELANRGLIVLAPDVAAAGERIVPGYEPYHVQWLYEKYPNWSYMGLMCYDHIQCLNYLQGLKEFDLCRFAAIGHSKGGHNSIFLAAADMRIKACVSSCGYQPFTADKAIDQWCDDIYNHLNPIKELLLNGYTPVEFNEIIACIAPRGFFTWYCVNDDGFPNYQGVELIRDSIAPIWQLYDSSEKLCYERGNEGHDFPKHAREKAYRFIDSILETSTLL